MPLVFVHGVANRIDGAHVEQDKVRRALFAQHVTADWSREGGRPAEILQPYWGGDGASLAWGGASLPNRALGAERFGSSGDGEPLQEVTSHLVPDEARPDEMLVTTARASLNDALDLLWAAALLAAPERAEELSVASAVVLNAAAADPHPGWLDELADDEEFVVRVGQILNDGNRRAPTTREKFGDSGVRSALMAGVRQIRERVVSVSGASVTDRLRTGLLPPLTEFLGDVLTYYRQRNAPVAENNRGIGDKLADVLKEANAGRGPRDPFVLVAHSMGGNIVYDLLTGVLEDAGVTVDLLVTAGSQVAFFEELSLFAPHPRDVPGTAGLRLPRPRSVRRWVNVYDLNDLLSFRAEPVFEGVEDYSFRSGRVRAHSAYFLLPSFYARLGARLGPLRYGPEVFGGGDTQR
ncbi:hypothetical protein [Streptomyces sp. N50]|uniref:hypothetical protein n=1 Tax=Streptomyces sp. N50 TaxID=3081765 RepID=UPI0029624C6F|nr:hypothetical protein [Streptomyces sp. N50]WOX12552.1 hypothetical protein R2B38_28620 [Streptomyces sp. N50]